MSIEPDLNRSEVSDGKNLQPSLAAHCQIAKALLSTLVLLTSSRELLELLHVLECSEVSEMHEMVLRFEKVSDLATRISELHRALDGQRVHGNPKRGRRR